MFSRTRLEPHSVVPTHQHPHEQLGLVLDGEVDVWIGDDRRHLAAGDAIVIPGGIPHGVETKNPLRSSWTPSTRSARNT